MLRQILSLVLLNLFCQGSEAFVVVEERFLTSTTKSRTITKPRLISSQVGSRGTQVTVALENRRSKFTCQQRATRLFFPPLQMSSTPFPGYYNNNPRNNNNNNNNRNSNQNNGAGDMYNTGNAGGNDVENNNIPKPGRLEELKQQEIELSRKLAAVRLEKLKALRSKPLTIGIVGFGRFGQFIAKTFSKHGRVVVTSRTDYSDIANGMGVTYVPLDSPNDFLNHNLDVLIVAVSILSFESTVKQLVQPLKNYVWKSNKGPLVVDVLSVKEHARSVMLQHLPPECDILCTHPMFGPDSGKNGWHNLNFVYERTRVDKVVFDPTASRMGRTASPSLSSSRNETFVDEFGKVHNVHEDSEAHVESMDRIERFLSIWEEEGCSMVPMSCKDHDEYAANSQFITHLMGRILGAQGLSETPIDTKGFQSVLKLVDSTTADSFDLFYGLYKYNQNSMETIRQLQSAMEDVVQNLRQVEQNELEKQKKKEKQQEPQQPVQEPQL